MKRKITAIAATLALTLSLPAIAQTTRVAYVDIDRVTEKSDKINSAMGKVSNRVEDIQKEIETKRARLVEVRAEIKKGEGVLAESEMKKRRDEATKLDKEMVDLEYEGRRELQKLDTTLFEPMIKTIVLAIQDVAKEKNIDLVLRGEAVIYGADAADITDDVVKKLNSSAYTTIGGVSDDNEDTAPTSSSNNKPGTETGGNSKTEPGDTTSPGESSKKSILPQVPLVTRPVDRQQD